MSNVDETAMCLNGDTIVWKKPTLADKFGGWFVKLFDVKSSGNKHTVQLVRHRVASVEINGMVFGCADIPVIDINGKEHVVPFEKGETIELTIKPSPYNYFESVPDDAAIVQIFNPRDKRWVKINRFTGYAFGVKKTPEPYKNVPILGWW